MKHKLDPEDRGDVLGERLRQSLACSLMLSQVFDHETEEFTVRDAVVAGVASAISLLLEQAETAFQQDIKLRMDRRRAA